MSGKGIGVGIGGALLLLKVVLLIGKASYRSPSYETTSYNAYDSYRSLNESQQLLREIEQEREALERDRAKLTAPFCATVPLSQLGAEVMWMNPVNRRVGLAVREVALGKPWPAPVTVNGVQTLLIQRAGESDVRTCVVQDVGLIQKAMADAVTPEAKPLTDGAWLVSTSNDRAGAALLMPKVLAGLKVKGELLAFVPGDNLVVFADSARPKAIAAAAKAVTDLFDRSGNSGCLTEDVLVLRKGAWAKWEGAVPADARAAALECQVNQNGDMLIDLAVASLRVNVPAGALLAPRSVMNGKRRATLDAEGEQLVAVADEVVIAGHTVPWAKLRKAAPTAFEEVRLDDVVVPGFYVFFGVTDAELRAATGVKLTARASP